MQEEKRVSRVRGLQEGDSGRVVGSPRMIQHGKAKAAKWSWTDAATGGGG